ncbi:putative zinc-binding metallopeptidase, partial [Singulisphaera rosea]
MKIFHCGHCDQLVFFENTSCVNCGHVLAYLPDQTGMGTLEPAGDDLWRSIAPESNERTYRLCQNYREENACNWAILEDDPNTYCQSCRLTKTIPDLSRPHDREGWLRLEAAKRRLIYSLLSLGLPLVGKAEDPLGGLTFEFLADPDPGTPGA